MRANINVGVITIIWSIDPIFMAIVDKILFGQKLMYNHIIGILSMLACCIAISLSDYFDGNSSKDLDLIKSSPTWVAVLFGVITPIGFTAFQAHIKHLTNKRINFTSA